MKLLEVDQLKSIGQGKSAEPYLSFKRNGVITLGVGLVKKICPESLTNDQDYYLHIYTSEEPTSDSTLGIVIDQQPKQGVKIRWDKANTEGREKCNICISAKKIVIELSKTYEWPLSEDKLNSIRYMYAETKEINNNKEL